MPTDKDKKPQPPLVNEDEATPLDPSPSMIVAFEQFNDLTKNGKVEVPPISAESTEHLGSSEEQQSLLDVLLRIESKLDSLIDVRNRLDRLERKVDELRKTR